MLSVGEIYLLWVCQQRGVSELVFRTRLLPPGRRKNEGLISYNALEVINGRVVTPKRVNTITYG